MNVLSAKSDTTELPLFYMSGSLLKVNAHEMVNALRTGPVLGVVLAISILLALPETSLTSGVPLWARMVLGILSCVFFIEMMSASVSWVSFYAARRGQTKLHVCRASTPTAVMVAILTETAQLLLLGIPIERSILLAKVLVAVLFWDTVVFILLWFYIPALAKRVGTAEAAPKPEVFTLTIGGKDIDPTRLRRIETDGRQLHLHLDDHVETVTAKMGDTQALIGTYGLAVHRCHWVAHDQLGPIHREGRTFIMTTRAGVAVPVSRERRKQVEDILAKVQAQSQ